MMSYAGKIPLRQPTTHQSPNTSKGKKILVAKVFIPTTMKELEFTPKVELVIKMSQKKPLAPSLLYKDMDTSMTFKVSLPAWYDLYKKNYNGDFPELTPNSDPKVRVLEDHVFQNIKSSSMHMVASRTVVFLCVETLELIINHTNVKKCLINNVNDQCVGVFFPLEVSKYYKLKELEFRLNTDLMVKFYEHHNTSQLLAS